MRKALMVAVGTLASVLFAFTPSASAKTKLPNCSVSTARRCTLPTKAQIRASQAARSDAVTACTQVNRMVAQNHLNELADPSTLTSAVAGLSRTRTHGPLAPPGLLREAMRAKYASSQMIALGAVQAWCGDLGVPA
jgi:hypothetical protein